LLFVVFYIYHFSVSQTIINIDVNLTIDSTNVKYNIAANYIIFSML